MVVICLPSAMLTGTEHERTAMPSMCTVQAPHWAMPQPYLVPVNPMRSRSTHKSGVSGSASTVCACPLTVRRAIRVLLLAFQGENACAADRQPAGLFPGGILDQF